MKNILRCPNGNGLFLAPRSGSHSFALAAMRTFWPEIPLGEDHPVLYLPVQEYWDGTNTNLGIIIRNPVERFRSMIARQGLSVEQQLEQLEPFYPPLFKHDLVLNDFGHHFDFVRHFKFETQLEAAAEWLGLPTPLPQEDATDEADKPILTPEQETRVRDIYAYDIALWESLKENK
jgi:hypothetical protein